MQKILVSTSSFGKVSNAPILLLEENGFELVTNPYGKTLNENEVINLAKDCVGIVAGLEPLNKKVIDECVNLKCISRVGVGMDNVDIDYAKEKGIAISNTPYGPTRGVAEMTLALTLSLLRKVPLADANLRNGIWKKEIGSQLFGKTIGVIGLGKIGKSTATIFNSLGNKVVTSDPLADKDWCKENDVEILSLNKLLAKADIITIHVPASKDKKALIALNELSLIKPGSFIINVSRGGVVDEKALYDLLKSKHLAGAAIDVFSEEPYKGQFVELDNVVLTPHMGSYTAEGKLQMEIDAVNNLINHLKD